MHRVPYYTSWVLVGLFGLAILSGLAFREHRSFCTGFCPAALLLKVYGRWIRFQLSHTNESVCKQCKTKDCVRSSYRDRWDVRSCPSYLRPFNLHHGDGCVICFQCAKVCPHKNIGFGWLRKERFEAMWKPLSAAATLFVYVASGFVAHELFSEVKPLDRIFHTVPEFLVKIIGIPSFFPWIHALWFLAFLPGIIVGLIWLGKRVVGTQMSGHEFWPGVAMGLLPIVVAGHAGKALLKMNSWLGFLPKALTEPTGINQANDIFSETVVQPSLLIARPVMAILIAGMFVTAWIYSVSKFKVYMPVKLRLLVVVGVTFIFVLYFTVAVNLF